jgi:prophage DNA circulation protein
VALKDSKLNGLQLIQYEMSRQHEDALASFNNAETQAQKIAEALNALANSACLAWEGHTG